ncbi:MAG: serine hydrolase domain-containing protein [Phycisphaerales bacterium JB052]
MHSSLQKWTAILTLVLSGICLPVLGADSDTIARQVDEIIARAELGRFRGAVVVRIGNESVVSRGYGFEDDELRPIDPQHSLFDVGSVAKSFTAATILRLVDQGKLRLDTTMGEIFAEQAGGLESITVEDLLRHRSGLGSGGRAMSRAGRLDSPDALINTLAKAQLGEKEFAYSNVGYFLLAAVIEKVGDASFEDVTRELVFKPAGLTRIGFVGDGSIPDARSTARVSKSAQGRPLITSIFEYPWNWGQRGATGVLMTPDTAAEWLEAIDAGDWLSDESHKAMLSSDQSTYGLGLHVDRDKDGVITRFGHGGSTGGFVCDIARYPLAFDGQGATVVLMAERGINLYPIESQVRRLLWTPPPTPSFAGVYLSAYEPFKNDGIYTISDALSWKGMPQYNGSDGNKRITDDRPTLILEDRARHMWSLMIRMDADKVTDLNDSLEHAVTQIAQDPIGAKTPWTRGITLQIDVRGLELTEYDSYIIDDGAMVRVEASPDHHVVLVISTPDAQHDLARVRMGGAETRALQHQIRLANPRGTEPNTP